MRRIRNACIFVCLTILLLLGLVYYYYNIDRTTLFTTNNKKGVEKYWNKKLNLVTERNLVINGKSYKLILSTSIDNKAYKYFNIYEQKTGGLYYKCLQACEQSKSKAKINFTLLDAPNVQNLKGAYTIVYGYNEALAIDNYEINIIDQAGSKETRKSNISDKEYFIDSFEGQFKGVVNCLGKEGRSMISAFAD